MNTYADLDLKAIRDACGLDFARHTYSKGQCSCCYGPQDMPAKYWAKGRKAKKFKVPGGHRLVPPEGGYDGPDGKPTYILFKNADNGSGRICDLGESVENNTNVSYVFRDEAQKKAVCEMLQAQLGEEYILAVPANDFYCIGIFTIDGWENYKRNNPNMLNAYTPLQEMQWDV